jgi:NAD-dependent SIR2 family protein deacetylase
MNKNYHNKLKSAADAINKAEAILIGGGAGLSGSAGLTYDGKRFHDNFADFIAKYGMTDMYSAGFYSFKTQEEKWGYWSRHIKLNRYTAEVGNVYFELYMMVQNKDYFVITTNVDWQFFKAGFDSEKVFAVQGDYGKLQCTESCHSKLYDNEELVKQMVMEQVDCRVPSDLVPNCPICGKNMEVNIRKDMNFLEDTNWNISNSRYKRFISNIGDKRIVLLELGVGYNTPTIIKYPFEQITSEYKNAVLVRINKEYPEVSKANESKTIVFKEDISSIINDIATKT